jgi:hypothetical protein
MTDTTTTRAICRTPLVGCLEKAKEYQSLNGEWIPQNHEQREFIRHIEVKGELSVFNKEEFDSIASQNEDEINKWLKDNGFTLTCPSILPNSFATASFVKMFVKWIEEGHKTILRLNDTQYPAVSFVEQIGKSIQHVDATWGVTCFSTKEKNTKVYCAMRTDGDADYDDFSEEQLLDVATALENNYSSTSMSYEGVTVPMIDLDIEVSQNWIKSLQN